MFLQIQTVSQGGRSHLWNSSSTQPVLELLPLALAKLRHLLLGHVVRALDLVEGVVRVLLELFADLVDLLLSPQSLLVLHLVQPPLLECGVGGLEATLGVAIDLVVVALGQIQSVEGVVDTSSVESGEFLLARRRVEAGEIETAGLLDGRLLARLAGKRGLFLLKESLFLSLLAGCLGLLCGGGLTGDGVRAC